MRVTVKLFATLRKGRFDIKEIDVPEGTTVGEIIKRVNIPDTEVTLIFINGHHGLADAKLAHRDTLALFPPIGGG